MYAIFGFICLASGDYSSVTIQWWYMQKPKSSFIQEIEKEIKELSKRHIQCETSFPLKDRGALGKLKQV